HPAAFAAPVEASNLAVGAMKAVSGNYLTLEPEGDEAIDALVQAMDGATDHIHILFYSWLAGPSRRRAPQAAIRAAQRGVHVRVRAMGRRCGMPGSSASRHFRLAFR